MQHDDAAKKNRKKRHIMDYREAAQKSKAWPFVEARKIAKRWRGGKPEDKGAVLFETGYGPLDCRISAHFRRCSAPHWCDAPMKS